MLIKGTQDTEILRDDEGFIIIKQMKGTVTLSVEQVSAFLDWLREGNGLSAEQDWNKGVSNEDM